MTLYPGAASPFASIVKRSRNLMITLGVVMILAGVGAIVFPMISTFGVTLSVGVMLIVASIAQTISAFSYSRWTGVILGLIIAALWLIGGLYLLARPLDGVFVLTIIVAAAFVFEGIIKTVLSFQMRPLAGWGWLLFDGIVSAAVGVLLWWQLPFSALWALGTLAGINIMISGWTLVILSITISKVFGDVSSTGHAT